MSLNTSVSDIELYKDVCLHRALAEMEQTFEAGQFIEPGLAWEFYSHEPLVLSDDSHFECVVAS